MVGGLDPTEECDGSVRVRLLDDDTGTEIIRCDSYDEAIDAVEEHRCSVTVAKIVDRNDTIVFTSAEMRLEDWVSEWEDAKRHLSVTVDAYDCPYDDIACFADDRCVQCKMDTAQNQY
ncbi:hypothetical protein [Natrinema halophilum]|uniref:Uncharacterized protein n=1 Tax=Natrinema halophilum TaxID=1699371 RepID=A0A7D5GLU2_9EURY|nr:hypothetical protein [Natrinema halophilum]QLG50210.1 hypothetical protein HYG82_15800 [Natrinema halophilum]